ncbi:hypothetical protein AC1031_016643 [Aphanomyces cochlioides]|nr:hypothetical protein AC1031_016643 [Aphanomyces cochlioides]
MSLVYISEDEDNDGQLDEKTLEMREKNRADRERRERHKIEKYGPDFRRAESDSSVTSLSGEDTDEYKERNYQKAQAKKAEKEAKEQRTDATQSSNVFNSVEWKKKRLEYERLLRDKCRHAGNAKSQMVGYIESCDPNLLRSMCETIWFEPDITKQRLRERIEEILNTPSHSFGITEADLEDYCHDLRMPGTGSVASRLGLFMMQVNDVIEKYALKEVRMNPRTYLTSVLDLTETYFAQGGYIRVDPERPGGRLRKRGRTRARI